LSSRTLKAKVPSNRLHRDLKEAYGLDGRSIDPSFLYLSKMKHRGFVNVSEHVYKPPLNMDLPEAARSMIASWADGFETYSLELLAKYLGKRDFDVLVLCVAAHQALRQGVDG
jgi:hypothetical protein